MSKLDRIQQLHRLFVGHQRPIPLKKLPNGSNVPSAPRIG